MAVLKRVERQMFDPAAVCRGFFCFARHRSWEHGINGLVADVRECELLVQFLPEVRNVTNHVRISSEEVAAGEWELRVSADLRETEEVEIRGVI